MNTTEYKHHVLSTLARVKLEPVGMEAGLPVFQAGSRIARLEPVTWADLERPDAIALLAEWRDAAPQAFPTVAPVTFEGTKRWLQKAVLETPDRILFWLVSNGRERIAHLGLFRFDYEHRHVEVDNIVRGVNGLLPGAMEAALQSLMRWTQNEFQTSEIRLKVFADNVRAVRLYQRLGFVEFARIPQRKEIDGPVTRWVDAEIHSTTPAERYFVSMRLPRAVSEKSLRAA